MTESLQEIERLVEDVASNYASKEIYRRRSYDALLSAITRVVRERDAWRELADDLLEDLELHGLHDSPEWNYRRQKAEFKRLDAALSTAEEKP